MRRLAASAFFTVIATVCSLVSFPYEDLTHQKLTDQAVKVAVSKGGVPQSFYDDYHQLIINGAGQPKQGEDYTQYHYDYGGRCWHSLTVVKDRAPWEPLNHFATGLYWGDPAWVRFLTFWKDALWLWNHDHKADAAFILGRAVHLVEDMSQPQHAMDEMHYPHHFLFPYHPSFLENFTEAHVKGGGVFCADGGTDYNPLIAGIVPSPLPVLDPRKPQDAVMIMGGIAAGVGESYGRTFTGAWLNAIYGPVAHDPLCDSSQSACQSFKLPFQFQYPRCDAYTFVGRWDPKPPSAYRSDDYGATYVDLGDGRPFLEGLTSRVDFAMKLAQGAKDMAQAGSFEQEHTDSLLKPGVGYGAAVIIAFWNEVKDSCAASTARESSGTCLTCFTDKPGGESPDDSVMVKASSRSESSALPASADWHNVCRVGIGKGLGTMADYGVSASIYEQFYALPPDTDPAILDALGARLEPLSGKYSGPQNLMPRDVKDAPGVAVLENGFGYAAQTLIESFNEPVKMLEASREPISLSEGALSVVPPSRGSFLDADVSKQPILILPTGSLYGLRADSVEHAALESYVEQGGVVVAFTQPYGDDFSVLPVPAGETLEAAGFKQDLSCFSGSAYPTMDHPILSGITGTTVTAGFDGYFRTIPSGATVLLRRTISGEPCMILYPVGQGYVVACTMYEDWAYANGQSTQDGRTLLANIITWAKNPGLTIPVTNLPWIGSPTNISLTLHVRNLSDTAADQVDVLIMAPDRQAAVKQSTQAVSIPAHSEVDVAVSASFNGVSQYGIFHADYRLLALSSTSGQEEEIQYQGESDTGRFVIECTGNARQTLSQTVFSTWTASDAAGDPAAVVHFHFEDHTGTARTMHLWMSFEHEVGTLVDTITLLPKGVLDKDIVQDLSRPGPYHYYLLDPT